VVVMTSLEASPSNVSSLIFAVVRCQSIGSVRDFYRFCRCQNARDRAIFVLAHRVVDRLFSAAWKILSYRDRWKAVELVAENDERKKYRIN
jgi:hypothetical protein